MDYRMIRLLEKFKQKLFHDNVLSKCIDELPLVVKLALKTGILVKKKCWPYDLRPRKAFHDLSVNCEGNMVYLLVILPLWRPAQKQCGYKN